MRILGVGNAAREHAVAEKLSMSRHEPKIYWVGDYLNPGINKICKSTKGDYALADPTSPTKVSEYFSRVSRACSAVANVLKRSFPLRSCFH